MFDGEYEINVNDLTKSRERREYYEKHGHAETDSKINTIESNSKINTIESEDDEDLQNENIVNIEKNDKPLTKKQKYKFLDQFDIILNEFRIKKKK
jgi:hypothetical protein